MSYHDKLIIALTENKLSQKPRVPVMIRACRCVYFSSQLMSSSKGHYMSQALVRGEGCKTAFHHYIMSHRLWRVDVEGGSIALFHLVPRS